MISTHQLRRVALEALTTERTAKRAYFRPHSVRDCTLIRLSRAATQLGLPLPPGKPKGNASIGSARPSQGQGGQQDD